MSKPTPPPGELIIRVKVHESVDPSLIDPQEYAGQIIDTFNDEVSYGIVSAGVRPLELIEAQWRDAYEAKLRELIDIWRDVDTAWDTPSHTAYRRAASDLELLLGPKS